MSRIKPILMGLMSLSLCANLYASLRFQVKCDKDSSVICGIGIEGLFSDTVRFAGKPLSSREKISDKSPDQNRSDTFYPIVKDEQGKKYKKNDLILNDESCTKIFKSGKLKVENDSWEREYAFKFKARLEGGKAYITNCEVNESTRRG